MRNQHHNTRAAESGFSLVETLVAITILLIVITGPMTISTSSARSTSFASEQVVAFFLAQEGLELVQKARDDEFIKMFAGGVSDPWGEVMDDATGATYYQCFTTTGCGLELDPSIDDVLDSPVNCSSGNRCRLYYKASADRSKYTYISTGAEETPYTRVITMELISADVARVESKVFWRSGNQRSAQEVIVETFLYDIYGN